MTVQLVTIGNWASGRPHRWIHMIQSWRLWQYAEVVHNSYGDDNDKIFFTQLYHFMSKGHIVHYTTMIQKSTHLSTLKPIYKGKHYIMFSHFHKKSLTLCARKDFPSQARVTSVNDSDCNKRSKARRRFDWWLFHLRQYCWFAIADGECGESWGVTIFVRKT